jgi:hypothetical protein
MRSQIAITFSISKQQPDGNSYWVKRPKALRPPKARVHILMAQALLLAGSYTMIAASLTQKMSGS